MTGVREAEAMPTRKRLSQTAVSPGATSRATKGRETKITAITIPGVEKMTWIPASASGCPNQPSWP